MQFELFRIILTALFIALGVILGYLLIAIPNLELMTSTFFLSGILLGKKAGMTVGVLAAFIWSSLNPWGSGLAFPPLLIAQCIGFGTAGLCGGIVRNVTVINQQRLITILIWGMSGFLITIFYDVLTNIAGFVLAGFSLSMIKNVLLAGIPLSVFHIISNIFIFAGVLPLVINRLNRRGLLTGLLHSPH